LCNNVESQEHRFVGNAMSFNAKYSSRELKELNVLIKKKNQKF